MEWFGAHGLHLYRLASADDDRAVVPDRAAKSISNEDTYEKDLVGLDELRRHLLSQSTRVADRLVAEGLKARCVHLKIRDDAFVTETRQVTLPRATDAYREIYGAVCKLLAAVETEGRKFRLTGVGVANFEAPPAAQQLDLLATAATGADRSGAAAATPARSAALQAVLSAVRERHGHQALYPADAGGERRPGSTGAITQQLPADRRRVAPKK